MMRLPFLTSFPLRVCENYEQVTCYETPFAKRGLCPAITGIRDGHMLRGLPNRLKNFSRRIEHSQVRQLTREWTLMESKSRDMKILRKVYDFVRTTTTCWPRLIVPFKKKSLRNDLYHP
jgi:hypothetical protein